MIVFGSKAEPIITGVREIDAVVVAAELGEGRIVAKNDTNSIKFGFLGNFKRLIDVRTLQEKFDILVAYGSTEPLNHSIFCNSLAYDFVKNGGALIYSFALYCWDNSDPIEMMNQIPYGHILLEAGLCYSNTFAKIHNSIETNSNKAENANLLKFLKSKPTFESLLSNESFLKTIFKILSKYAIEVKMELEKIWIETDKKLKSLFQKGEIDCKNLYERQAVDAWQLLADLQPNQQFKAPYINIFPGDYQNLPKLVEKFVGFSSDKDEYFFTGAYVAAGSNATLEVTKVTGNWKVNIGVHTDILSKVKISRWPKMVKVVDIKNTGVFDILSYIGGSVVFVSLKGDSNIEAKLSNIVISPRYDSQDKSSQQSWNENRKQQGLWADISGKYVTISLSSSNVINLNDPDPVIEIYDNILVHYYDLKGVSIVESRKMWIVTDRQTSSGYMHAGYPIVTHLDVANPNNTNFLLCEQKLKTHTGNYWGIFHEIGHNMQEEDWMFDGLNEVICNVFALYGSEKIGNTDPWKHPWLRNSDKKAVEHLNNGSDFNVWKTKPEIALYVYDQLVNLCGWSTYKKVFQRYPSLPESEKPKTNKEKIDKWFTIFSEECNMNLSPLALFWGIPLSENITKYLKFEIRLRSARRRRHAKESLESSIRLSAVSRFEEKIEVIETVKQRNFKNFMTFLLAVVLLAG
ncbi:hypothetical protein HELRODRAFT_161865 [Helobdella robusta]|uniref:Peptidase M60 domain-containing protein n=1 Tax=Helobdella robusta TaxID=6412 RepID=T1ERZ2_HELRO|nr:hypothetical protein HELRODRAFT_161865 [Helobdella robusta]ESO02577.1 hypothetical protein HELRODRAFT_161865 [Helobdella robusta]